jgi:hypothetical protein
MQRELWSVTDLRNSLTSTYLAASFAAPSPGDPLQAAYLRGFRAALVTLALAFGLPSLRLPEGEALEKALSAYSVHAREV